MKLPIFLFVFIIFACLFIEIVFLFLPLTGLGGILNGVIFGLLIEVIVILRIIPFGVLIAGWAFGCNVFLFDHFYHHPEHLFLPLVNNVTLFDDFDYFQKIILNSLTITLFCTSDISRNLKVFLSRSLWYLGGSWFFSEIILMKKLIIIST